GSTTNAKLLVTYGSVLPINNVRVGFPDNLTLTFSNTVIDTATGNFGDEQYPVKFRIVAHTSAGDKHLKCFFVDQKGDSTLSYITGGGHEEIRIFAGTDSLPNSERYTWYVRLRDDSASTRTPALGDVYN